MLVAVLARRCGADELTGELLRHAVPLSVSHSTARLPATARHRNQQSNRGSTCGFATYRYGLQPPWGAHPGHGFNPEE